jgi:hypothetical protein
MDERLETLLSFFKHHNGDANGYRFNEFKIVKSKRLNIKRKIKHPVKGLKLVKP